MNITPIVDNITISNLIDKITQKKIILDPVYQRELVWNDKKMVAFIDSLMKGYIPNNIIVNKNTDMWTCIDGKQRITSIVQFCVNAIPLCCRDQNNEEQLTYFSAIPETQKNKPNIITFDKQQQKIFYEKKIIVVIYNNLSYIEQCEVFNRIQAMMSSTTGERVFSLFKNPDVAIKFKEFCKKYDYMNKGRFRNVDLIINILYMQKNKSIDMLTGNKKKVFVDMLDDINEYNKIINIVEPYMAIFFSEHIMNHKTIIEKKLPKNFIVVMFYLLFREKINKIKYYPHLRNMILKIWKKWNINNNKELTKTTTPVLQKIELIYLDNNNIIGKMHNNLDIETEEDISDTDEETNEKV